MSWTRSRIPPRLRSNPLSENLVTRKVINNRNMQVKDLTTKKAVDNLIDQVDDFITKASVAGLPM